MTTSKKRYLKLTLIFVGAVLFWTIGTGFYRDLAAKSEETYKGLKIFSDVIELIEKKLCRSGGYQRSYPESHSGNGQQP